jgi:hypothetical protein
LLVSDGHVVSRKLHPKYKAALVAGPTSGGAAARVLDLGSERLDPDAPGWNQVAQSFMLFDHAGHLRIRKSNLIANRTVVAEDRDGHLLVFTTEGGYTLHELARLLRDEPLHLTHAMSMDGGDEAALCVKAGGFRYASFGEWNDAGPGDPASPAGVPLPAVIAVRIP